MDATEESSRGFAALEASLCSVPDIEFAVVFGSRSKGDARASSDLDVAVKFSDELSSHERFQKRCFLSGELQRDRAPFVDISDIEALPLEVARDAVDGELLCGSETALRQFRRDVEAEFEERRDDIRRHHQDVIDRIAEDGLRGHGG